VDGSHAFNIGHPAARVSQSETGNSRLIHLVATIGPATNAVEQHLHTQFETWKLNREWFDREQMSAAAEKAVAWEQFLLTPPRSCGALRASRQCRQLQSWTFQTVTVMCGHGDRVVTAASLLAAGGRNAVTVLDGGHVEPGDGRVVIVGIGLTHGLQDSG